MIPSPYLYQTELWQQFWLKTHDSKHECIEISALRGNTSLRGLVYVYQWRFGQKLMHLAAGPHIDTFEGEVPDKDIIEALAIDFLSKVMQIAKQYQAVALRINFDPEISSLLNLTTPESIQQFVKNNNIQHQIGLPVITKSRLMFPTVAAIDLKKLKLTENHKLTITPTLGQLQDFMKINDDFWLNVSETTRKQTRKSTKSDFILDTEINEDTVNEAYNLIQSTSQRQSFTLPSKEYFVEMSHQNFFRSLIIRDQQGVAHSAWLGIIHGNALTNQYGGNDEISLKNYLPNLSHLYGMYLSLKENCRWYDLGGYEKDSKQAKFKDGYRPTIIEFAGGVDLVYLPWYYRLIELGGKSKKLLRK